MRSRKRGAMNRARLGELEPVSQNLGILVTAKKFLKFILNNKVVERQRESMY